MTTSIEKALEWIELAQAGAEVGIADPAMRVTVLQNLTQAIELLQFQPPESAATEGGFIEKFLSQMSHLEFEHEALDFLDKTLTLRFVEDVRHRLTASTGARILGYADSGGGIRWREDAGGYTGHLWSGAAPSAPSSSAIDEAVKSLKEAKYLRHRPQCQKSEAAHLGIGMNVACTCGLDDALAKLGAR